MKKNNKNWKRTGLVLLVMLTMIISPSITARIDIDSDSIDYTGSDDLTMTSDSNLSIEPTDDTNFSSDAIPTANNTYDLGSNALRWNNIYGTYFFGDGSGLTGLPSGFTYSDWFDQDLNTTNSTTFDGLTLDGNLDMNSNDINNANDIEVENQLTVLNDIKLHDKLEYDGGGGTHLDFNPNQIIIAAGGINILNMQTALATFGVNVTMNENLTISGDITPTANNTYSLGSDELRWNNIYGGSIVGDGGGITNLTIPSETFLPISAVTEAGTQTGGDIDSMRVPEDGLSWNVTEAGGGVPVLRIKVNFTNITTFDSVIGRVYYSGGQGHEVQLEIWRFDTEVWENYIEFTDMTDFVNFYVPVFDPIDHINTTTSDVWLRFDHAQNGIPSHEFRVDYVAIIDGFTALTVSDHDALGGRDNKSNHPWAMPTDGSRNFNGDVVFEQDIHLGNTTQNLTYNSSKNQLLANIAQGQPYQWKIQGTDSVRKTPTRYFEVDVTQDWTGAATELFPSNAFYLGLNDKRTVSSGAWDYVRVADFHTIRDASFSSAATSGNYLMGIFNEVSDSGDYTDTTPSYYQFNRWDTGTISPSFTGVTSTGTASISAFYYSPTIFATTPTTGSVTGNLDFIKLEPIIYAMPGVLGGFNFTNIKGFRYNPAIVGTPTSEYAFYANRGNFRLFDNYAMEFGSNNETQGDAEVYWDGSDVIFDTSITTDGSFHCTGNITQKSYRIKLLATKFTTPHGYANARVGGTTGTKFYNAYTAFDLVATVEIPPGYKATHVCVYGENSTNPVTVYENRIDDGTTAVSKGVGTVNTELDITDVECTSWNYLTIFVDCAATLLDELFGGYITIEAI